MKKLFPRHALLALCAGAAALTACGGGGGGAGSAATSLAAKRTTDVPASAQQSVSGLVAFLNDMTANMTSETGTPILVGDATIPTSDTIEPSN